MAADVGLSLLPVPLVHLAGLDVQRNAVHKYIQDSFRASQNVAARFDFVPIDNNYAPKKETREHVEQYVPRGIFKKKWMIKHLSELPSVICLFVDLEWTDQNWDQRLTEIVSKIAIIRHLIEGRRIQICLVLLQKAEGGEKNTKRVDELQLQTELPRNRIFVLPVTPEHLTGYIQQLQARLLERANSYYESIVSELKLRIENNASKIYPLLFCRYLFKAKGSTKWLC
ncbi:unnamed protein product [Oikopleura dioica]|uniref:Uncharacterized protein n=1 Tax=Oikopleura dioica TaxID=34765 RepID=E4X0I6_OIKDI|nr:unnamed protein product [Oikopleura dioica]CBY42301.1 unnamed protein product [Oikopleura dioica]